MKEKDARGKTLLILPEDKTMYFLSGTRAPTRVHDFAPGIVAPGRMIEELFEDIERERIKYLLWSNRLFPEYGAPVFGKDLNQKIAAYLEAHYRVVGPLVPVAPQDGELSFMVWKRAAKGTPS